MEVNGGATLYVPDLPGFSVVGSDVSATKNAAQFELPGFLGWLEALDLAPPVHLDGEIAIVETLPVTASSVRPRFDADLRQPDEEEIELALAVGRALISELIDATEDARAQGQAESAERVLRLIAERDRGYLTVLQQTSSGAARVEAIDDLIAAAGSFEDAIDARATSTSPDLWRVGSEEWSLAKALRRRSAELRGSVLTLLAASPAES